jgi:hypothetical protein
MEVLPELLTVSMEPVHAYTKTVLAALPTTTAFPNMPNRERFCGVTQPFDRAELS